jgi:hypothetical protein
MYPARLLYFVQLYFTSRVHFLHLHTTLALLLYTSTGSDVEKAADSLHLMPLRTLAVEHVQKGVM